MGNFGANGFENLRIVSDEIVIPGIKIMTGVAN